MLRICLIPVLVSTIQDHRYSAAFAFFVMAASTDVIDGLLARWLHQRTRIGQYLDPVADKLMLSSLFLVLTFEKILDPRIALLVFGRDLGMLLSAAIIYRLANVRDFHPTLLGKANSFSQIMAVGMVLFTLIDATPWIVAARQAALEVTVFLTVLSGFHYGWVASQRIDSAAEQSIGFEADLSAGNTAPRRLSNARQPSRVATS
jgi:cardiolipin synthase